MVGWTALCMGEERSKDASSHQMSSRQITLGKTSRDNEQPHDVQACGRIVTKQFQALGS